MEKKILKKWGFSLTHKLVSLTLAAMLICGVVNAIQFTVLVDKIKDQITLSLKSDTQALVRALTDKYTELDKQLKILSDHPNLSGRNEMDITQTLNQGVKTIGSFDALVLLDLDGHVMGVNNTSFQGTKLAKEALNKIQFDKEDWFQMIKTDGKSEVSHDPKAEPWIEAFYHEQRFTNVIANVIKDSNGKPFRILAGYANFSWFENRFVDYYEAFFGKGYKNLEIALFSKNGTLLFEYDPSSHEYKKEVQHDFKVLGVRNSATAGVVAVMNLIKGETNVITAMSGRKKIDQLCSYSPISGTGFPDFLGWGVLMRIPHQDVLGIYKDGVNNFFLGLIASCVLLSLAAFFFLRRIGLNLSRFSKQLTVSADYSKTAGESLKQASSELATASDEQERVIGESIKVLTEMGEMIFKTGDTVRESEEYIQTVSLRGTSGKEIMMMVTDSMASIEAANSSLQEISKIIHNIGDKTGVINEIVRKTQLLSFNASIEAARAGHEGRGFSVVAEEIGNLAKLSGSAANEIELLIEDSEKKVGSTLSVIRERVSGGNEVCSQAFSTFGEIVTAIETIREQIKSIKEASIRQDVGIKQSQKSMDELSASSKKTQDAAQTTKQSSEGLESASMDLSGVTIELEKLVIGKNSMPKAS